jgi:hypothetical protein
MNGVPDCHAEGIVEDRLLLLKSRRRSEVSCCHSVGRRLDSWFLLRSRTVREPRELHALGRVPEKLQKKEETRLSAHENSTEERCKTQLRNAFGKQETINVENEAKTNATRKRKKYKFQNMKCHASRTYLLPVKTRLLRFDTRLRLEGKEPCIPLKPRSTEVTVGPVQPTPVQTEPQGSVVLVQPEKPDGQVAGETAVLRDIKPNV